MLQNKIREAFCASISLNPRGYQYLHTVDFVSSMQQRGIHFSYPAAAVVGLAGHLSGSGSAGRTTMFSGGQREMSIFNGPLTDDEIDSVTSWLLSKRGILNS
ncbi:hypothetical protein MBR06_000071 [Klebsiella pneumoniae]|jgi:hypothetical protein|uniref:hypothetical protein n=1 Tax=Klebsiella pneumoniae TaxID=573 RepID=UPI0007CBABFB|nr:hypothetical protein [Klebsiella pneumoniae]EKU4310071.1 hypothetical protein [Klebsiella pneumoniae]EKV0197455.1 hypothetical protein [Klebsiella pneumoniae]EKV6232169.1 hypothetical protein [Klebsiella pneumoniae]EKV7481471.1 hypothetical protein [Klebsiella pneumoniae]EKX1046046.1 hypothetical protein [Klebsiella pneumoniae]